MHATTFADQVYGAIDVKKTGLVLSPGASGYSPISLRVWRTVLLTVVNEMRKLGPASGSVLAAAMPIFTFGVFRGDSMYLWRKAFPHAFLAGFDSFTGLPAEKEGEVQRQGWFAGKFADLGSAPQRTIDRLSRDLGRGEGADGTRFVKGFYNETLTTALARSLPQPAAIVDIDSDIYVSAPGTRLVVCASACGAGHAGGV
jgi:hypothetical protein